jgi:hypothetical protein
MTYGVYKPDDTGTLKLLASFVTAREARHHRTENPGSCIYRAQGIMPDTPPPGALLWLDAAAPRRPGNKQTMDH